MAIDRASVLPHRYLQKVKLMDFGSRRGANRSDTCRYREAKPGHKQSLRTVCAWRGARPQALRGLQDLQRHLGLKDAVLFAGICGTDASEAGIARG